MPSSKIWRKGRWYWYCPTENNTLGWKDHWACAAVSRFTYSTPEEAEQSGRNHTNRKGHPVNIARVVGLKRG